MGKFFDSLTKSGLQDANGDTAFYGSPQAALDAGNAALSKAPHPTVSMVPPTQVNVTPAGALPPGTAGPTEDPDNPRPPILQTSGGGAELSNPTPNAGKIVKPSFNDINVDSAGNQKRLTPNSGLTKLGALFSILGGGVQGMSDAMASGAMDAHNGPDRPSPFGAGLRGAEEMPLIRAARAREVAEQNAKIQQTEAQTQNLQGETALHQAQIPYFLQRGKAYNALAQQRGNLSTQQQLDLATQDAIDAGRSPDIDPNVLQLRAALKAETEAKGKGGATGAGNGESHTVQTKEGVFQFNPDTQRYDIRVGSPVHEPSQGRQPSFTEEAYNEAHAADPTLTRADFLSNKSKKQPTATFKDSAAVDAYSDKWYQGQKKQVELDKYRAWEMAGKPEGDDAKNDPALQQKYQEIDNQYNKDAAAFEDRKKGYYAGVAQGRPVSVDETGNVMDGGSQPQSSQPTKKSIFPKKGSNPTPKKNDPLGVL